MIAEYSFEYIASDAKTKEPMADMEIRVYCEITVLDWSPSYWDRYDQSFTDAEFNYSVKCGSVEISIGGWNIMDEDFSKIPGQLRDVISAKIETLKLSDFGISEHELIEEIAE